MRGPETDEEKTGGASRVEGKHRSNVTRLSSIDVPYFTLYATFVIIQCTTANYANQKRPFPGTTHLGLSSNHVREDVENLQTSLEPTAVLLVLTQDTFLTLQITFGLRCGR